MFNIITITRDIYIYNIYYIDKESYVIDYIYKVKVEVLPNFKSIYTIITNIRISILVISTINSGINKNRTIDKLIL